MKEEKNMSNKSKKALTKKDKALIKKLIIQAAMQKAQHTHLAMITVECFSAFEKLNQMNKPVQGGGKTLGSRVFSAAIHE